MKKFICFITALFIGFSFTACNTDEKNVSLSPTGEADTREQSTTEEKSDEQTTENSTNSGAKIVYGENTGTDKTYTGLEPLPCVDFEVSDPDNAKGLSTVKISHSFGVARNETAHEISQSSQQHFDEGGFDAITLDTVTDEKVVYLTFDVGYDNGYTGMILDTLKEKNVTAAFFCTVDEMESDPESIARMINEGHIVGNHTDTHPSMDELTRTQMMEEIKGFDDYIRTNFGYSSLYFRFPKGEYSDCALDLLGSLGYTSVFWSLAYSDWDTSNQKGAQYALETVTARIHPGAVILLHAVSSDNAQALGDIIDTVRNMGYEFRSLEDYKK
ncbi:MAG: polysaccharide deacetylase family protein [Clostridia bacterium]|nr:polysaccharide deacetylase family protein [Clostridia bacterium]